MRNKGARAAIAIFLVLSGVPASAHGTPGPSAASIGFGHGGPPWLGIIGGASSNDLLVSETNDGSFLISDSIGIEGEQLCHNAAATLVICPRMDSDYFKEILGPGGDRIRFDLRINGAVYGDEGNDRIVGTEVRGTLDGGDGDDSLNARGGNDYVHGGDGADKLLGGLGDDVLRARDGHRDRVIDCGPGKDRVLLDPENDPKPLHCETVIPRRYG